MNTMVKAVTLAQAGIHRTYQRGSGGQGVDVVDRGRSMRMAAWTEAGMDPGMHRHDGFHQSCSSCLSMFMPSSLPQPPVPQP